MRHGAARPDPGVLELGVGADPHAFGQLGARTQTAERTDRHVGADRALLQVGALDPRTVANPRVSQLGEGPDHAVLADHAAAGDGAERMDHRVLSHLHVRVDEGGARVGDRHAGAHQGLEDPPPHRRLGFRELHPVVDPQDLLLVTDPDGMDLALDQPHDVGQVVLAGLVSILQPR